MSVRSLPPLAQIRAFAALAETGSMSAAGALLNVSHSAISQQVRALERRLGVKLTEPHGRGVALTAQGAQLAAVVQDGFHAIARQIEEMTGADAARPVQVSTTPMFAASWLMPRIADFRARHPEIDLMLNPTAETVPLAPGGIDIAIRYGRGDWPGLDAALLLSTEFLIVAASSLIGGKQIDSPADLLQFPWLQELGTDEAKLWLARQGVTEGRVKGMTEVPGSLLLDGLRAGQGVAATTRAFIEPDIEAGSLVVLFEDTDPGAGYWLVTRKGPLRPAARAFATWLRRQARAAAD